MFNVGAGLDIICGRWYQGKHDESLLNGGCGVMNGFVGGPNLFKTTVGSYKMFRAMARVVGSTGSVYETEMNANSGRMEELASYIPEFEGERIIETERLIHTNRELYTGDEWYEETKDWLAKKYEDAQKNKDWKGRLPFIKKGTVDELMEMILPTFGMLDSFTDFFTKDVIKMSDDVELGGKGAETMWMRQGIQKTRLMSEFPPLLNKAAHYFFMTAQVGAIFNLDQYNPEKKKFAAMQGNIKMKGVTSKFEYLMNSILQFYHIEKLLNSSKDKYPRFPRDEHDNVEGDSDLQLLHAIELRGKNGPSGVPIKLVVSQKQGVMPELTEFYGAISHPERFGLVGNDRIYSLALCPDIKLQRTTVRRKIAEHATLRRALNINMELMQMCQLMPELRNQGLLCTAEELFEGVKAQGFDWDQILGGTRGWWTINNDDHPVKYLSTMDLMRMRIGKYKPYWM
jgi:hypothetical protein